MVTFDDFRHAFVQAEEDIKYAELAIDSLSSEENEHCMSDVAPRGVIVPSINELRYAANHLSNALVEGLSSRKKSEQIDKAIRHCVRARLDALKATLYFLIRHFQRFSQDYSRLDIPNNVRNQQHAISDIMVDLLRDISQSHFDTTNAECDMWRKKIQELHGFYLAVEKQRDVLNQLRFEFRVQGNSSYWQFCVSNAIAMIIGVISVLASLYFSGFF